MRLLDLFSGIGGFSYAAEKLVGGYETVAFCEQDKFCQQVLRKHWKDVPIYDDVRTIDATRLGRIDIVAGGFPCQAVSQAGLQKGTEDDRWLWDEMFRIIQDCKPKWVIGENVVGLININEGILFEQVQTDLENEGYSVQSFVIPACAKNAPTKETEYGLLDSLLPTPTTQEIEHPELTLTKNNRRLSKDGKSSHSLNLADTMKLWPTPTAGDHSRNTVPPSIGKTRGYDLSMKVVEVEQKKQEQMWPTPRARNYKDGQSVPPSIKKGTRSATLGQEIIKTMFPTPTTNGYTASMGQAMIFRKKVEKRRNDRTTSETDVRGT